MTHAFATRLVDHASLPYRAGGNFAYHFARGKLGSDCIFRELLRRGVFPASGHFLDLGCGQAVLASWLLAARTLYEQGEWPTDWPQPPIVQSLRGFELMEKDVARARSVFDGHRGPVVIAQGDICNTAFGRADVVTILDVLHYIDFSAQEDVLRRVRDALAPEGLLITRVGDADGGLPFHVCNWVDHAVTFVRGHRLPALYCRSLTQWQALLTGLGFSVEVAPMSAGKPFANNMLIARLSAA
jgi:SAM-dependent methyltransferase